jgi:hypothetical protein
MAFGQNGQERALMRYGVNRHASLLRRPRPTTAATPLTPSPPIDPSALRDHTLPRAQLPDPHGETES